MSTITKLDPLHRIRRSQRAAKLRSLLHVMQLLIGSHRTFEAARASITHSMLAETHRRPDLTGFQKEAVFNLAANVGVSE